MVKLILLSASEHRGSRSLEVGRKGLLCLMAGAVVVPGLIFYAGFQLARQQDATLVPREVLAAWQERLQHQDREVEQSKVLSEQALEALTVRVAQLQAGLVRIDALGQRVSRAAKLDGDEFDSNSPPAVGGPGEGDAGEVYSPPAFTEVLDQLAAQMSDRAQQLEIMATLLVNRQLRRELEVAGQPLLKGWVTSLFGYRTDPFKGHRAWHNDIDFGGQLGAPVMAVASGVVTWSGEQAGYGQMDEINHGGGYVTRYGHNQGNRVKVGDVVKKGQVIANLGSTGRSTGPHVHFEVYKNGKSVDPASYIKRQTRS